MVVCKSTEIRSKICMVSPFFPELKATEKTGRLMGSDEVCREAGSVAGQDPQAKKARTEEERDTGCTL